MTGTSRVRQERGWSSTLPAWHRPLAVVAHPDDESFGLGAVLASFVAQGAAVGVLCLTHGEASTLHGTPGDLRTLRAHELTTAAKALGVESVELLYHPDGALANVDPALLTHQVTVAITRWQADGVVVFDADGVTGHPDHAAATRAVTRAGSRAGPAVLAWTLPESVASQLNSELGTAFTGRPDHGPAGIDLAITVHRDRQLQAVHSHPSQAVPGSALWRRLELLGEMEYLAWLPTGPAPIQAPGPHQRLVRTASNSAGKRA